MEGPAARDLEPLRDLAARFVAREVSPLALARDRYPFTLFDHRPAAAASSLGFMSMVLPEAQGGVGLGQRELAAVLEVVAEADASTAVTILVQALGRTVLAETGPPEAARDFLHPLERAEPPWLALPLYADPEEPPAGVRVSRGGDGDRLTGRLEYVAFLPVARSVLAPAGDESGHAGLYLVEAGGPGVEVGPAVVSLGLRACPAADLILREARGLRLGGRDGAAVFSATIERFRAAVAATALGLLRGTHRQALEYARERSQGGRPIIGHDMMRRLLAEQAAWLDLGGLALARACDMADGKTNGAGTELLSLQALLTSAAIRAAEDGVQVLGGYGYMHGYGQEKRMRDARQLAAVFGGARARTLRILERRLDR
ncbi:MAG: acyl-CoA dehydrogenase family protein [Thermodesulfobacteriota bacterium]